MGPPRVDAAATRAAVAAVADWLRADPADGTAEPGRAAVAAAVRLTARTLAAAAPGASVEVRIPPFAAVQCLPGPAHTRGTPPNVVETDPRTWLRLACGLVDLPTAEAAGVIWLSGVRAGEIGRWLPLMRLGGQAG